MNLVFSILRESLLVANHLYTLSNSVLITSKSTISCNELNKLVSSAYFIKIKNADENWISLI